MMVKVFLMEKADFLKIPSSGTTINLAPVTPKATYHSGSPDQKMYFNINREKQDSPPEEELPPTTLKKAPRAFDLQRGVNEEAQNTQGLAGRSQERRRPNGFPIKGRM